MPRPDCQSNAGVSSKNLDLCGRSAPSPRCEGKWGRWCIRKTAAPVSHFQLPCLKRKPWPTGENEIPSRHVPWNRRARLKVEGSCPSIPRGGHWVEKAWALVSCSKAWAFSLWGTIMFAVSRQWTIVAWRGPGTAPAVRTNGLSADTPTEAVCFWVFGVDRESGSQAHSSLRLPILTLGAGDFLPAGLRADPDAPRIGLFNFVLVRSSPTVNNVPALGAWDGDYEDAHGVPGARA